LKDVLERLEELRREYENRYSAERNKFEAVGKFLDELDETIGDVRDGIERIEELEQEVEVLKDRVEELEAELDAQ